MHGLQLLHWWSMALIDISQVFFLGLGFQSNTQLPKTNSDGFSHAPSLSIPFFRTWIEVNEYLGMNGTYSVQNYHDKLPLHMLVYWEIG